MIRIVYILMSILFILVNCPQEAVCFSLLSARGEALANCHLSDELSGHQINPATRFYQDTRGYNFPLYLGLFKLGSLPSLDPESEDFDPLKMLEVLTPLPFHLVIYRKAPPEEIGINMAVWQDSLRLSISNLDEWVGEGKVDYQHFTSVPLFCWRTKQVVWRTAMQSYLDFISQNQESVELLTKGETIKDSTTTSGDFQLNGYGVLTVGAEYGRSYPLDISWLKSVSWGVRPNLLLGVVRVATTGNYEILANDIDEAPDILFASEVEMSYPFAPRFLPGAGLGLDLGIAGQINQDWCWGIGFLNVLSQIWWKSDLKYLEYNQEQEELQESAVTVSKNHHNLPWQMVFSLNGKVLSSKKLWLINELEITRDIGSICRLALEYSWGRFSPRAGVRLEQGQLLPSAGLGIGWGPVEFNLGVSQCASTPFYDTAVILNTSLTWLKRKESGDDK